MTKIIKINNVESGFIAYYDFMQDKIYYHSLLDKFPEFKKFVIDHEKEHARRPLNLFWHLYIDVRDGLKKTFTYRCEDYVSFEYERKKDNARKMGVLMMINMMFYPLINNFFQLLIRIFGMPFTIYYSRRIKR